MTTTAVQPLSRRSKRGVFMMLVTPLGFVLMGIILLIQAILVSTGLVGVTASMIIAAASMISGLLALSGFILFFIGLYRIVTDKNDQLTAASIKEGWTLTKKDIRIWLVTLIVSGAIIFGYSAWFGSAYPYQSFAGLPTNILAGYTAGNILSMLLGWIMSLGLLTFAINLYKAVGATTVKGFFSNMKLFWKWIGGQLMYQLILIAGLLLFILPGLYWAVKFKYWDMFLVEKGLGPIDALKASWKLTEGNWWNIFTLQLAQTGVQVLGVLALLIGLFWAIPTNLTAKVASFTMLLGEKVKKAKA